jgi:hypothetical protein
VTTATRSKLTAALDPRVRIQRDRFNEYFVFLLSATGAAVIAPCLFLLVAVLWEKPAGWLFVAACVVLELLLIFGVGRPAMKPLERVGWALLWGFSAAVLGLCFYELVLVSALTGPSELP